MAPFRSIRQFNNPVNPFAGGKAGSKDPRHFISGNIPGQNWDIQQFAIDEQGIYTNPPPQYSQVHADRAAPDMVARTVPTRVNMVPWQMTATDAVNPFLVVPRNTRRVSLLICNPDAGTLLYSFGKPTRNSTGQFLMAPLGPVSTFKFTGESVPINDLWMTYYTNGADMFAYEGIEALEANLV